MGEGFRGDIRPVHSQFETIDEGTVRVPAGMTTEQLEAEVRRLPNGATVFVSTAEDKSRVDRICSSFQYDGVMVKVEE